MQDASHSFDVVFWGIILVLIVLVISYGISERELRTGQIIFLLALGFVGLLVLNLFINYLFGDFLLDPLKNLTVR
jgi:uncharacterized membrane protein